MRNIVASILITAVLLAGCQSAEKAVFVESSKINSKGLEGNSFTKPYMSAYKDLYVVRGLEKSGKGHKSSYRCLDLNKGTFSWWLQVGFTWNSDEQPDDIKSFENKLYINQGNTLVNFNLENGGPVWQSREKIDFILKADQDKVFCLSEKMLDMREGEYRNILCYDTNSQKLLWSVKAMLVESWNVRIGNEEVAYYSSKEEPITLHIISRETGLLVKQIDNVTKIFANKDEPSNVLYLRGDDCLMLHTPKEELRVMNYTTMTPDKTFFFVENDLVYYCPGSNFFFCYNLRGEQIWSRKQNMAFILYSDKKQICFFKKLAKDEYNIDALNPQTGDIIWTDGVNLDAMPSLTDVDNYAVYPVTYDKVIVRSIDTGEVVQSIKDVNGFNSVWGVPGFGFMIAGKDGYLHFYNKGY